jgi:iron complex outermembrane receptor protein
VVNAQVGWTAPNGLSFTVFGQNLTNQVYAAGFLVSTFTDYVSYQKPRWFGFRVGYAF